MIRILQAVLFPLGISWGPQFVRFSAKAHRNLGILALPVVAYGFFLFFVSVRQFPYFSTFSTVDEQLSTYLVARNFNEYGFLSSAFLPDESSSSDPRNHPFVYTHHPAGAYVFTGLLTEIFGPRYPLVRVTYASIFLAGLACFFTFVRRLFRNLNLPGAGFAFLFLTPAGLMTSIDHPIRCAFPLFVFFPLVALQKYYDSNRKIWLYAAILTLLVSSCYLTYSWTLMVLVSWFLLSGLRLIRFERCHLRLFCIVTASGVLLHLLQNVLFLGFGVAVKEIGLTLSNRTFGRPTGPELADYFQSINVVHNGTHHLNLRPLFRALLNEFTLPGGYAVGLVGLLIIGATLAGRVRYDSETLSLLFSRGRSSPKEGSTLSDLVRLGLWIIPTVCVQVLSFPAYASDYCYSLGSAFFVSVGAAALSGSLLRDSVQGIARTLNRSVSNTCRVFTLSCWVAVLAVGCACLTQVGRIQWTNFGNASKQIRSNPYLDLVKLPEFIGNKVVMTNIYPVVLGFFTKEAALGGAEFGVFPEDRSPMPDAAYAKPIRDYQRGWMSQPTHFVLFRGLYTGYTRYRDTASLTRLRKHIAKRHRVVYECRLYTVFELVY